MRIKKFEEGGAMTDMLREGGAGADVITGGLQAIYGYRNLQKANRALSAAQASAPSLDTPAQYYENYKNAYDSELARMENDTIQSNLATSIQALQGAGGRALVGGLNASVTGAQSAQNRMLSQERAMRNQAGARLAAAEERTRGIKYRENVRQQDQAQQAAAAARQNIASGLTNVATGVMFGGLGQIGKGVKKGVEGVKKGFDMAKDAYQMARLNLAGDGAPLADQSENMTQFVNNFRQNFMLGDMRIDNTPQEMSGNIQRGLLESQKQFRPNINPFENYDGDQFLTPENVDLNAVAAQRQKEFIGFNESQKSLRQESTIIPGFNNTGDPTRQQQYIIDNSATPKLYQDANGNVVTPTFGITPVSMKANGGMMTEGSFDHKSNPIDIVQNGVKVGEATGGEYILNPEQAKQIAKQSTYARKLFKKFEKNAKSKK